MRSPIKKSPGYSIPDTYFVTLADNAQSPILGQPVGCEDHRFVVSRNNSCYSKNVIVFGASDTGKTLSYVYPNVLQSVNNGESVILTDTQGLHNNKNIQYIINRAKEKGYTIKKLDLFIPAQSDKWDILGSCINEETACRDAEMLARAIIRKNILVPDYDHAIYNDGSQLLLEALILRVYLGNDFSNEHESIKEEWLLVPKNGPFGSKTMDSIIKILSNREGYDFLNTLFDPNVLREVKAWRALEPFNSFNNGTINLLGNIVTHLKVALKSVLALDLDDFFSYDEISLTLPGDSPCLYICSFPPIVESYANIASLFIEMLYNRLVEKAAQEEDRRLKIPVNFYLDDFSLLGTMSEWAKRCSISSSRNINISMVIPDMVSLEAKYGEINAKSIIASCGTWLNFGTIDQKTNDLIASPSDDLVKKYVKGNGQQKDSFLVAYSAGESPVLLEKNLFQTIFSQIPLKMILRRK